MQRFLVVFLFVFLAFLPVAGQAAQDDTRLPRLFAALKATQSPGWGKAIEREIIRIWNQSTDPQVNELMEKGLTNMAEDKTEDALDAFNALVKYAPNFAEGWAKRAMVEYLHGDYKASLADIDRTLKLEPRHFDALSERGEIELAQGEKALALKAFNATLDIDPYYDDLPGKVESLKKELAGGPN